jgi:hypothetical protein
MAGKELVDKLIAASGLPENTFKKILAEYLNKKGVLMEHLTLDDFRELAKELLDEVLLSKEQAH